MSIFLYFLRFNWKMLLFSYLSFTAMWQIYTGVLLYQSEIRHIDKQIKQNIEVIEEKIILKDIQALKRNLWNLKGKYTNSLVLKLSKRSDIYVETIVIGKVNNDIVAKSKPFSLKINGANLGKLDAVININGLIFNSLFMNIPLFLFVGCSFMLILFSANYQSIKSIKFIEKALRDIKENASSGSIDMLQKTLQKQISDKRATWISGKYAVAMEEFLKIIKERQELDKDLALSEEKYKLTRIFAHNVKTPLKTINVLSESIKKKLNPKENKLFDMAINRLLSAANRVLVKDIEFSELKEKNKKRDIISTIKRIIETKKKEYSNSPEIRLEFINKSSQNTLLSNIQLDPLFHILSNLINNSYDAIIGSGHIKVFLEVDNNSIVLEINDTGRGIPEEIIDNIWKEGFSYNKRNGNGLGLAHAKQQIEEKWKGKCKCISELGKGTIVSFKIPVFV